MLNATREEIHQVNNQLCERIKSYSEKLASVRQIMAKNRLILSIINAADTALKERWDESVLFQQICAQMVSECNYNESWIISTKPSGKPVCVVMSDQCHLADSDFVDEKGLLKFCPAHGIHNTILIKGGGDYLYLLSPQRCTQW